MITLKELQEKVERRISEYVEFDIREIFTIADSISIYGGAVRDSIADLEIHDVDILCMPQSAIKLKNFVESKNFEMMDLHKRSSIELYKDISVINEPWTLMNDHKKIIQIIRPAGNKYSNIKSYKDLIKNVDISCCGVFLDGFEEVKLQESCKDAIVHCLSKTFELNEWSALYNVNRTGMRKYKLEQRGWQNIYEKYMNKKKQLKMERNIKIKKLDFKPEYEYKIWNEEDRSLHPVKVKSTTSFDFDLSDFF